MRVDAFILGAIARELNEQISRSRIDTVIAPTPQSIALQCYGNGLNRWLLLSVHPQLARVHLLKEKPRKLITEPSTFVMLLRKYLENGRIDIVEWITWERIIHFDVLQHDGTRSRCIIEVMGNLSNIILVDANEKILGSHHAVPPSINRYRTILTGHTYVAPPPQTRLLHEKSYPRISPLAVTDTELIEVANSQDPPLPVNRLLLSHVAGMSQDITSEIACQVMGSSNVTLVPFDSHWGEIATTTRLLGDRALNTNWNPVIVRDENGQIRDGALFPLCLFKDKQLEQMPDVNTLLATYFAAREWGDALNSARANLHKTLKTLHDRLIRKLKALQSELLALNESVRLRIEGEMLLAFASDIPEHATTYTPPDLDDGVLPQPITLDPQLSAIDNANLRFNRYHKMRRAAEQIPDQIDRTKSDIARVEQFLTDLDMAESIAEIAQVREIVTDSGITISGRDDRRFKDSKKKKGNKGKNNAKPGKAAASLPPIGKSVEGFPIYVGKNSIQNEQVTFSLASGNDFWFHARGVPGAHVIVKCGGRTVSQETIQYAARLAAWYSQSRGSGSVAVDYTEQRYVRHMKNGGPGMVIYTQERTLHAVPRAGIEQSK
jgi:predicted ribosome quality control (RQC) complex YloA/Tae2 family protein